MLGKENKTTKKKIIIQHVPFFLILYVYNIFNLFLDFYFYLSRGTNTNVKSTRF